MVTFLEFEKPVAELEARIKELKASAPEGGVDIGPEVEKLEAKAAKLLRDTYAKLSPWQKTMVARHPMRPHFKDIVGRLIEGFTPLAGDRKFGEDAAIQGGLGRFRGRSVMVIGHEKGSDTASRIKHNFGMGKPEGYRKAARLMELASRFNVPIVSFVDTSGAFPGVTAEERGQAEALLGWARVLLLLHHQWLIYAPCRMLSVPVTTRILFFRIDATGSDCEAVDPLEWALAPAEAASGM